MGKESPADVLISVDAGRLVRAKNLGLLQPVFSDALDQNVPKSIEIQKIIGSVYLLGQRVIVYAKDRVKERIVNL